MKKYVQVDSNNYVLETENEDHKKFYARENHCSKCGHELKIKSKKKIGHLSLVEETYCPSCQNPASVKKHSIN